MRVRRTRCWRSRAGDVHEETATAAVNGAGKAAAEGGGKGAGKGAGESTFAKVGAREGPSARDLSPTLEGVSRRQVRAGPSQSVRAARRNHSQRAVHRQA